jgi:hypothetical protein
MDYFCFTLQFSSVSSLELENGFSQWHMLQACPEQGQAGHGMGPMSIIHRGHGDRKK